MKAGIALIGQHDVGGGPSPTYPATRSIRPWSRLELVTCCRGWSSHRPRHHLQESVAVYATVSRVAGRCSADSVVRDVPDILRPRRTAVTVAVTVRYRYSSLSIVGDRTEEY